jgi:hypothetical protein
VNRAKATERIPRVLEGVRKNLPVYGAWNGQRVVLGTGETLLGPIPAGDRSSIGR